MISPRSRFSFSLVAVALLAFTLQAVPHASAQSGGQGAVDDGTDGGSGSNSRRVIPFWQCITPNGSFTVSLRTISSVSTHTYVVDGTTRVYEAVIGTGGSELARFYYLEAITQDSPLATIQTPQNRIKELTGSISERVVGTSKPWDNVVKNYPGSTHAHTIEYRVPEKELVTKIFESAEQAWITGRGAKYTITQSTE